jgi:hypothetical protein
MATKYGVNATKRLVNVPSDMIDASDNHARVYCSYDSYALSADLAANDVIVGPQIPNGARIVDVLLAFDDLDASGGTVDVGWAADAAAVETADDDGFMANVDVTSAGTKSMIAIGSNLAGVGKKFSAACNLQIKIDGDTDATSGTVKVWVLYTLA